MQNDVMGVIFYIVAGTLDLIAQLTGLTYEEINIIVYYFFIPFSWVVLIDKIYNKHYLKISFLFVSIFFIVFLVSNNIFQRFSLWLFDKSAIFLNSFGFLGLDYYSASVVICVFGVVFVYALLISIVRKKRKREKSLLLIKSI
ncbi:MAG: hypothetical protein NTU73_00655 [Ignavibacteriae bacterium]|nr:hypothetical protein [Ignavibacteriota bacterium]